MIKEKLPFICVINPPRHGKSRFLDSILKGNADFKVIEITYNASSPFVRSELATPHRALYAFWMRVLAAVHNATYKKILAQHVYDESIEYDLAYVMRNVSPDVGLNDRNLVIGVDEFSKLTDEASEKWSESDQREFISQLQREKGLSPLRQYVFTGFNTRMTSLLSSSSCIEVVVLTLGSFSDSRKLLRFIIERYEAMRQEIPMLLFETVKSTPGLAGLWAERLECHNIVDRSFESFTECLAWYMAMRRALPESWRKIVRYFLLNESGKLNSTFLDDLIADEIAVYANSGTIVVSPFAFVVIVESLDLSTLSDPLQVRLHAKAMEIVSSLKYSAGVNSMKSGRLLEEYFELCISFRVLLLRGAANEPDSFPLEKLIPADEVFAVPNLQDCQLHLIHSKRQLSKLLTPVLYFLFPLGLKWFATEAAEDPLLNPSMSTWVKKKGFVATELQEVDVWGHMEDRAAPTATRRKKNSSKIAFCVTDPPLFIPDLDCCLFAEEFDDAWFSDTSLRDVARDFWTKIDVQARQLVEVILSEKCLFVLLARDSESAGPDALMILYDSPVVADRESTVHLIAVKLKDRHTDECEWERNFNLLTSHQCIIHRTRNLLKERQVQLFYHIVFADL